MMPGWGIALLAVGTFIVGLILGFFLSRIFFKRYLKKNPPINENQIRAMYASMGRTASEKDIRRVMKQMEQSR